MGAKKEIKNTWELFLPFYCHPVQCSCFQSTRHQQVRQKSTTCGLESVKRKISTLKTNTLTITLLCKMKRVIISQFPLKITKRDFSPKWHNQIEHSSFCYLTALHLSCTCLRHRIVKLNLMSLHTFVGFKNKSSYRTWFYRYVAWVESF